jgi:hypothetical protein
MQAMTLSIGQTGIKFFAQTLVANRLLTTLGGLKPPNRSLSVPDFTSSGGAWSYSNIRINLSNGSLGGFSPSYNSVTQLNSGTPAGSQFALDFTAASFTANYTWSESYHQRLCTGGKFPHCNDSDPSTTFNYSPSVGSLDVKVTAAFGYNQASNTWAISTVTAAATTSSVAANIPGRSIIQWEGGNCFNPHVTEVTEDSIKAIDFGAPLNAIIPPLLKSIPASGDLGNGIVFEWELGDAGLTFPSASGISIGITGRVSYQGAFYDGAAPALSLPPVPTDGNHLQTYVSNYEVNALQWAYFKAGLLNSTATPGTIADPKALKVETYVSTVKELKPYRLYNMFADIKPQEAPVSAFQMVWQFNQANVDNLKPPRLPHTVWIIINNSMLGNVYVSQQALETDLQGYNIGQSYYKTIENGTSAMAMVNDQTIEMILTIQTPSGPKPTITFNVTRTDILTNLNLGIAGNAQTMQFGFTEVQSNATFVSSTIPNFPGSQMAMIWATVGGPEYDQVVAAMGKTGVPLPIMSGFQFLFSQAVLNVQDGFVWIISQVQYKST